MNWLKSNKRFGLINSKRYSSLGIVFYLKYSGNFLFRCKRNFLEIANKPYCKLATNCCTSFHFYSTKRSNCWRFHTSDMGICSEECIFLSHLIWCNRRRKHKLLHLLLADKGCPFKIIKWLKAQIFKINPKRSKEACQFSLTILGQNGDRLPQFGSHMLGWWAHACQCSCAAQLWLQLLIGMHLLPTLSRTYPGAHTQPPPLKHFWNVWIYTWNLSLGNGD